MCVEENTQITQYYLPFKCRLPVIFLSYKSSTKRGETLSVSPQYNYLKLGLLTYFHRFDDFSRGLSDPFHMR